MHRYHRRVVAGLSAAALASTTLLAPAQADDLTPVDAIAPHAADYGHYLDTYGQNTTQNMTPESNPAIGVLAEMLKLWTPGESWNDGTKLNAAVLDHNIAIVERLTNDRSTEEGIQAYLSDRRNQNYSMLEGLGVDQARISELINAGTTIPDQIPADATTVKYDDGGNDNGQWGDADSALGSFVDLVNTVRGPAATSNRAKEYYQYMRPFRWSADVDVLPELRPAQKPDSEALSDGGFPSGHTNAAFLAGYAMAAATPEHYAELMLRASELGESRVVAGMHNAIDVMGGRVLATGIAASVLADPANADLLARAKADVEELVGPATPTSTDRDAYQDQLAQFLENVTFDYEPGTVGPATVAPRVPKGAEVLLDSRLPYLDDDQVRWVLYSTALESGYPILDDAEGWGRLNLFAAAHGFGSFDRDVAVTMDASQGGFSAADVWLNDIDGAGALTKAGTGALTLAGLNSYSGGTTVTDGTLAVTTATALGTGDVALLGGVLDENSDDPVAIGGDLRSDARLELGVETAGTPALTVEGAADLDGTVVIDVTSLGSAARARAATDLPDVIPVLRAASYTGAFDTVEVIGADGYTLEVRDGVLSLVKGGTAPTPTPTPSVSASPSTPPSRPGLPSTGR